MPTRLAPLSIALGLAITGSASHADENDIAWNGFLNIVGGQLQHQPIEDFSGNPQRPTYLGYDDTFDFNAQSSGALQAKKQLDEQLSVTMQLYGAGSNDNFSTEMKWLYVTWEPTYHSNIRIGKLTAPLYYYSDYLNVGYAYHWVTPPETVYPFDSELSGFVYTYQDTWSDLEGSIEFMSGNGDDYFPIIDARVFTRNGVGVAINLSSENWFSLRALILKTHATFEIASLEEDNLNSAAEDATDAALAVFGYPQPVIDAIRPALIDATAADLNNGALDLDEIPITYGALAVRAETDRWFVMTEFITVRSDAYVYGDLISGFVSTGIHDDKLLYHLTYSKGKANPENAVSADRYNDTPAEIGVDAVADVIASQTRSRIAGAFLRYQQSLSAGVRYEMSENTALKLELTRFKEKESFDGDTYGVGKNTLVRTALSVIF